MNQERSEMNKQAVARELLRIEAVFLRPHEPFTWASGIKSPIYCDNRLILSDVEARRVVEDQLARALKENFNEVDMVMGTATAGIPHAAYISDILDLPMGYVRGSVKNHGRQKRIEGAMPKGARVVVIEDLISTGGSSLECVEALGEEGAEVLGVLSIFSYGMEESKRRFKEANTKCVSVLTFDDLLQVALDEGVIDQAGKKKLELFRDNPHNEEWMGVSTDE